MGTNPFYALIRAIMALLVGGIGYALIWAVMGLFQGTHNPFEWSAGDQIIFFAPLVLVLAALAYEVAKD